MEESEYQILGAEPMLLIHFEQQLGGQLDWCLTLIPTFRRMRQVDLYECQERPCANSILPKKKKRKKSVWSIHTEDFQVVAQPCVLRACVCVVLFRFTSQTYKQHHLLRLTNSALGFVYYKNWGSGCLWGEEGRL